MRALHINSHLLIGSSIFIFLATTSTIAAEKIYGYTDQSSAEQQTLEAQFDKNLDAKDLDAWMKKLSSVPHHAGSEASKENAEYIAGLFTSWGYAVEIEEFDILLPTPKIRELSLLEPTRFSASLRETTLIEDPSTAQIDQVLPPYNAFSADGDVTSELVFVNYGIPEDYEELERFGISVEGKIVIAKYGRSWRGIKPKLAAEKGAIGAIIYSDPADDGYAKGDVYPVGAFKHETGVQRGSVMDMPLYPGDALTPGVGATKNARRLKIKDAKTISKIPVLPISYKDAQPLLAALGGEVVPDGWQGALPLTYHLGPGPAKVRLRLAFNWDRITAYDVIARLEGSQYPDEWVIRGNHHDGWNHGAADPISGLVAMLAEAKSISQMVQSGRRPERTIIYAAWDAEEPGLIGSTEWAEYHAKDLKKHAVAYINTDGNGRGFIQPQGSHTLERLLNQIANEVTDPQTGVSIAERKRAYIKINGTDKEKEEEKTRKNLRIEALGSGSDYSPFLQHLGIASVNLAFRGESAGGSYHTLYDTYKHYTTWVDNDFSYGIALAQTAGRATLRLANADLLPFDFNDFAETVTTYIGELEELAEKMQKETNTTNALIDDGTYTLALDPSKVYGAPVRRPEVPFFNFAPLKNAIGRLSESADAYHKLTENEELSLKNTAEINELLYTSERLLTRESGLPGRSWYKHHIYAPGFYTGYGVKTLPGIRESIEEREYELVAPQLEIVASVLNDMAVRVEELTKILNSN
jgi:N-acetylated-alpha-linked acidic dipeptidase